jgi:hypothetical protein
VYKYDRGVIPSLLLQAKTPKSLPHLAVSFQGSKGTKKQDAKNQSLAIYPGKRTTGKKSREFLPRAAKERKNILTNFDVFPREKRTQKETIPSKNLKLNKTSSTPESHIFFDFHP